MLVLKYRRIPEGNEIAGGIVELARQCLLLPPLTRSRLAVDSTKRPLTDTLTQSSDLLLLGSGLNAVNPPVEEERF